MRLSDFFIGKPGPGSISEAVAMKLPVIVESNAWTLPQERYNANGWPRSMSAWFSPIFAASARPWQRCSASLDRIPRRGLENREPGRLRDSRTFWRKSRISQYDKVMRLLPILIPAVLFAQPDPRELIRQSAEAIKQFNSYELESVVFIDMQGGPIRNKLEMPSKVAVRRPDRMRIESRSQAGGITIVSDGEHTWFYMTPLRKYIKREASGSPEAAIGNSGLLPKNLPDVSKSIKNDRLTGQEEIGVAGQQTFDAG